MKPQPACTALSGEPAPRLGRLYARLAPRLRLLQRALFRLVSRLPPSSRIRRTAYGQIAFTNYAAWCREDVQVALLAYHPQATLHVPSELTMVGFDRAYHGHNGLRAFMRQWAETWAEFTITPTAFLDHGPELVFLTIMRTRGIDSSAETSVESPQVIRLARDGRVIEQSFFMSRQTAAAAGIELP